MTDKIKSTIWVSDVKDNINPHPLANRRYYHTYVESEETGMLVPAFFTDAEIKEAIIRAEHNPEDILPRDCGCWGLKIWGYIFSIIGLITLVLLKIHNLI